MQIRRFLAIGLAVCVTSLTGCGAFFQCEGKASCSTTGSGSSTVTNYAYVANSSAGSTYISGYSLAGGTLSTATTGSPYALGYTPIAMVVNPANTFLYVAVSAALSSGTGNSGIYVYTIGTGGALSIANGGVAVAAGNFTAVDISPDGKWLFALDTTGLTIYEYAITTSTGVLGAPATQSITPNNSNAVTPVAVKVAPTGNFVVATLGTAGDVIYSFNTSTGLLGATVSGIGTGSSAVGDYAVTIDANNDIYIARTTGVALYTATSAGVPTLVNLYTTGNGPHSVAVLGTSDVYVGNQTDSTISGFTVASGPKLTAFSATTAAPQSLGSLAIDKSGTYLVASGYSSTGGLQLYTIGSSGTLTSAATAATGTTTAIPAVLALTH